MPRTKKETFSSPEKNKASRLKLAMSLDYIFGKDTSKKLDLDSLDFEYSRRTGRLRYVLDRESKKLLFTLRTNGSIAPTIPGAQLLLGKTKKPNAKWAVTVIDGVSEFVSKGKTVFCRHVARCDDELRGGEDVAVLNEKGELLAVGKSVISGYTMKQFKRGVAVKVREGIESGTSAAVV